MLGQFPAAQEPMHNLLIAAPAFRRTSLAFTILSLALVLLLAILS